MIKFISKEVTGSDAIQELLNSYSNILIPESIIITKDNSSSKSVIVTFMLCQNFNNIHEIEAVL